MWLQCQAMGHHGAESIAADVGDILHTQSRCRYMNVDMNVGVCSLSPFYVIHYYNPRWSHSCNDLN